MGGYALITRAHKDVKQGHTISPATYGHQNRLAMVYDTLRNSHYLFSRIVKIQKFPLNSLRRHIKEGIRT